MSQTLDRSPTRTVLYVSGHSRGEIKQKVTTVMKHSAWYFGEQWIMQPDLDGNVTQTIEWIIDNDPGESVNLEEQSLDEPLQQLWVCHDKNASSAGRRAAVSWLVDQDRPMTIVVPDADHLVTHSEGSQIIKKLLSNNVNIHLCESGLTLRRGTTVDGKTKRALRTVVESISGRIEAGDTYKHTGGRPPLGFTVKDSELRPGEDYERVCSVLQQVKDEKVSRREAADRLGCVRATINNCLDRGDMYQLN